jgi:hypothetical protein
VRTDRTIANNKLDSLINGNRKGTYVTTNFAILADINVIKKEAEKVLKYEYLTVELQRTWSVNVKLLPVITGRLEPFQNHSYNTRAT